MMKGVYMAIRETPEQAGYINIEYIGNDEYILTDEGGQKELWFNNPGHGSYGISLKNGDELEFARSL